MSDIKGGLDLKKIQELFVLLQQYGPMVFELIQKLTELLNRPSLKGAAGGCDDCGEGCDHLDCAIEAQLHALAHLIHVKHGDAV